MVEERLDALEHLAVRVYHYFKQIGDSLILHRGARDAHVDNAWRMVLDDLAELDQAAGAVLRALAALPDEGIRFDRVLMGKAEQRLEAGGVWLFDGPDDIRADLQNFDLAVLKILYPDDAPDFAGNVDLHFEFRGDLGSAIDFGARVGYNWSTGVIFGIVRSDWLQLSVSVDYAGDNFVHFGRVINGERFFVGAEETKRF